MKVTKGSTVKVDGKTATVRGLDKVVTGKRGRPAILAAVQFRDERGHFIPGTTTVRARTLQPA